jgi:hypothetical protein
MPFNPFRVHENDLSRLLEVLLFVDEHLVDKIDLKRLDTGDRFPDPLDQRFLSEDQQRAQKQG